MMLEELLNLYKIDCDQKDKLYNVDDFVAWIKYNREVYLRMAEEHKCTPSKQGMVGFIRTRQHEEHQKLYAKKKRRLGL